MNSIFKDLRPHRLVLYSWMIWFFAFLLAPFTYIQEQSITPIIFLVIFSLTLYVSSYTNNSIKEKYQLYTTGTQKKIIKNLLFISYIGILLRFYELAFIENVFSYASFTEFRLQSINDTTSNSSNIGVVGALLFPFGLPVFIYIFYHSSYFTNRIRIFAFFSATWGIVEGIFLGGRLPILYVAIVIGISLILKKNLLNPNIAKKNKKKTIFKKAFVIIIIVIVVDYVISITTKRYELFGVSNIYNTLEITKNMKLYPFLFPYIENSIFSIIYLFIIILLHYLVHPVIEYNYVF